MSTVPPATPTQLDDREESLLQPEDGDTIVNEEDEQADEEPEEDEEPKLKYAKLTASVAGVYRNGDFTTAFCVAGDKMVVGTQDGNIHVLGLPAMETLRTYHAHSASITSCSVSPIPPPPSMLTMQDGSKEVLVAPGLLSRLPTMKAVPTVAAGPKIARLTQPAVPSTPTNQIYVATSSIDGHVCIASLIDPKDVQLRNFARPVQAVALSPDYKVDRTYLSGGRAGNLILTVGGKAGVSSDANTNSAAAAASGWLGSIGLGANNGRDTVLHQGEGSISTIKWSLSGKWVVWVNEEGIKIMRSHLRLEGEASEDAWRRVAHAAKPSRKSWEDMAGVWKSRVEWVDDRLLERDNPSSNNESVTAINSNSNGTVKNTKREKKPEKLIVGWGDTAWIMHVHEGGVVQSGKHAGSKQIGSADIIHKLQFRDCIVSGVTLYTPSMLAILAYRTRDDDDNLLPSNNDTPRKGRQRQHTSLAPQLRLVNVKDGEEVDLDELSVSRFETLSAQEYQLGTLYIPPALPDKSTQEQRGALESIWEASGGGYATRLFSSGASMLTRSETGSEENGKAGVSSPKGGSIQGVQASAPRTKAVDAHPFAIESGLKLFIHSPYDCVLAVKRDLSDHLDWLLEHHQYKTAWQLLDKRPEILEASNADRKSINSSAAETPSQGAKGSLADFFADSDSQTTASAIRSRDSTAVREKRRIGELWLTQLTATNQWGEAGKVAGTVLGKSGRWEHWVFTFAQAEKFDEITPFMPSTMLKPPLPGEVYEAVLNHYLVHDPPRMGALLDSWDTDLFDVQGVITAIESRLRSGEVTESSTQDGVQGRDWTVLLEALAKLYLANGQAQDALQCYIRTQNAEAAMDLIRDEKVTEALADDIPGFVTLKVTKQQLRSASLQELEEASAEVIDLLAEEALRGSIPTVVVVQQLQQRGGKMPVFLFFYFRALWRGGSKPEQDGAPRRIFDRRIDEGHMLVEDHADLAVELFAEYDRTILLEFLQSSEIYSYDKAIAICEHRHYIPELVHVLGKTGQLKRALWLIIGELGDVVKAISFVKENPDLWEDLLEYGMDKPTFIRGLLEEVGTAVDPVELVRRILIGLEIPGLKQGLTRLVKEYEIQHSISEGVARVLRGEVTAGMDVLRAGQRKAVRFDVVHEKKANDLDITTKDVPTQIDGEVKVLVPKQKVTVKPAKPGHCVGCGKAFHEDENEPLLGFACGHVYHLSCLLRAAKDNPTTDDDEQIAQQLRQLGYGDARPSEIQSYGGRSVGAKVAHAHVIGNVVQGGCRRCFVPAGA
ncbi:Vacuolar protein sorting-associated protein 41 [Oleoguttula sp. CCFEE 5521]